MRDLFLSLSRQVQPAPPFPVKKNGTRLRNSSQDSKQHISQSHLKLWAALHWWCKLQLSFCSATMAQNLILQERKGFHQWVDWHPLLAGHRLGAVYLEGLPYIVALSTQPIWPSVHLPCQLCSPGRQAWSKAASAVSKQGGGHKHANEPQHLWRSFSYTSLYLLQEGSSPLLVKAPSKPGNVTLLNISKHLHPNMPTLDLRGSLLDSFAINLKWLAKHSLHGTYYMVFDKLDQPTPLFSCSTKTMKKPGKQLSKCMWLPLFTYNSQCLWFCLLTDDISLACSTSICVPSHSPTPNGCACDYFSFKSLFCVQKAP